MKAIAIICSLFLVSFFLSGCIEVTTTVKIKADGSGTLEETVFMSNEIVKMIKEFSSSFDSSGTGEEFTLFKESELKDKAAKFGDGVKYISGNTISEKGREGYKAVYSFRDINKLTIDENPTSRIPDNPGAQSEGANENLTFGFIKGKPSEIIINMPAHFMKDFSVSLKVQVDGTISSTNATYVEGNSITIFSMNFVELMENTEKLKQLEKSNFQNIHEVKDLLKDIPGIKIETNNPVKIEFN
jgi:hypothetical protein